MELRTVYQSRNKAEVFPPVSHHSTPSSDLLDGPLAAYEMLIGLKINKTKQNKEKCKNPVSMELWEPNKEVVTGLSISREH